MENKQKIIEKWYNLEYESNIDYLWCVAKKVVNEVDIIRANSSKKSTGLIYGEFSKWCEDNQEEVNDCYNLGLRVIGIQSALSSMDEEYLFNSVYETIIALNSFKFKFNNELSR